MKFLQLKRTLCATLFVLLLSVVGMTKMQAQTVQHINYGITSTDPQEVWVLGVDVSYYGNMLSISIPSSVIINMKTYSVVGINAAAFNPMTKLNSATIPSTVRSVGGFVNCANLQTININSNVDFSIGGFSGCSNLTNVNISHPNRLTMISSAAFNGCSKISSFTIPVNVTMI